MYTSVRCEKMFRVSIGNLPDSVSEGTLRGLFEARNLAVGNILLKKDGAIVDCPDQTSCDKAVEALHGENSALRPWLSLDKMNFFLSWMP